MYIPTFLEVFFKRVTSLSYLYKSAGKAPAGSRLVVNWKSIANQLETVCF